MSETVNTGQQDYGILWIPANHKNMRSQDTYLLKSDEV